MKKVLITGCSGLVGTHLIKKCIDLGYDVIGTDLYRNEFLPMDGWRFIKKDLTSPNGVEDLFTNTTYDVVFNTFGVKGSPMRAKTKPVDFLYPSFKINTEIINQCAMSNIWLVFVSSVGVYAPSEKFIEDSVWETLPGQADWFPSWSKRMGELLLEAYSVQYGYKKWSIVRPANIFGEYDDFSGNGTVIASTIKKVVDSSGQIEAWGDGSPIRDFVYAGDVANGLIKMYENKINDVVNFGSGIEITIKEIVNKIVKISDKEIDVKWDSSKPNGDLKRLMDTTKQIKYDILPEISFDKALKNVYEFYSNTTK
jgi:GDP-L-fucose synthase